MTSPGTPGNGAAVTLREVYALIKEVRADLLLEIGQVGAHVDTKFSEHMAEHNKHDVDHEREQSAREQSDAQRRSLIRWAVTTLISAAGVFLALFVAFRYPQ